MTRKAKEIHVYLLMRGWTLLPRKPHEPLKYLSPYNGTFSDRYTRENAMTLERLMNRV